MQEKTILVVDDERPVRELLKSAFDRAGYEVLCVASAEEALEILKQKSFPLMFIDLGLKKMNGFELCEHIRNDSPDAIIYALTGYAGLFGEHEITEAGFDGYFAKPVRVKRLYQITKDSFEKLNKLKTRKVIKQILIVDDDEKFRKMLRKMLELEGYEVVEAADGNEAVNRHSQQPFDLIITDIIMPGKEGIETILDIKDNDPNAQFIVVSGNSWFGSDVEFDMAKTLGARTLRKPFERKALLEAIEQIQNQI
jgi:CheY-like chemotaxis protein